MQKTMTRLLSGLCAVIIGAVLVTGCPQPITEEPADTIKLAYVNWAEGVAVTHLVTVLLEDMGYNVEATMADVGPIYLAVAEGDQDIMIETWLPVTHEAYYEQYGDRVELISTWFDTARIGLVVPAYVDIDSIEEMNEHQEKFGGMITGIDAGAGIMSTTERAIEEYGLDFALLESSDPAMVAALQGAVENDDWIVVTGWAPHWKFARFDIKFLDDPKGIYGATELIHAAARLGFSEEYPEVTELFRRMEFDDEQIGTLMAVMEDAVGTEERAARQWIRDNQELVDSWLP